MRIIGCDLHGAFVSRGEPRLGRDGAGLQRDSVHQAADRRLWTERLAGGAGRIPGGEVALVEQRHAARRVPLRHAYAVLGYADHHHVDARLLGQSLVPGRAHLRRHAYGVRRLRTPDRSRGRAAALVSGARVTSSAGQSFSMAGTSHPLRNRRRSQGT